MKNPMSIQPQQPYYPVPKADTNSYKETMYDDVDESSGYSGTYQDKEQDLLRDIIDVKESLEIFEHRVLRGEKEVIIKSTGEKKWITFTGPIMNEIGIREIMGRLSAKVTKASKLTYKEDEELYKDMFYTDMSITEMFAKRAPNWKMDIEVAKSIKDSVIDLIWDCVSASRNGFLSINIRSTYQKSDVSRQDNQEKNSGGFLSKITGGRL